MTEFNEALDMEVDRLMRALITAELGRDDPAIAHILRLLSETLEHREDGFFDVLSTFKEVTLLLLRIICDDDYEEMREVWMNIQMSLESAMGGG